MTIHICFECKKPIEDGAECLVVKREDHIIYVAHKSCAIATLASRKHADKKPILIRRVSPKRLRNLLLRILILGAFVKPREAFVYAHCAEVLCAPCVARC